MKIKKIDMIFIAVIGIIFISAGYVVFLKVSEMLSIKNQMKAVYIEANKKEEMSAKIKQMKNEIKQMEKITEEFESQLPSKKNIEDFLVQINDIAGKSGLVISGIKPQAPIEKDFYSEIPITINASATYSEVCSFLYLLKKIQRINKLESISIKNQNTGTNQCDVDMVLKIFISDKKG